MFSQINDTLANMYNDLTRGKAPDPGLSGSVIASLKSKQVRIFGAGRAGRMLRGAFAEIGIPIRDYIDRNCEQIGSVDGVPVHAPATLKGHGACDDTLLIIAAGTMQLAELIEEEIRKLGCQIPTVNGLFLVYVLQYLICDSRHERGLAPDIFECTSYHVKPYKCPIFCKHVEGMAFRENPYENPGGAAFNEFGYLLSEVCTLKCKHCLEAVPYLKHKEILPREIILKDIRKMARACRFIHRLDLVGGEPFLHPEFTTLVEEVRRIERIGYLGVFTNGTVVPGDDLCRALRSDRIIVTIANYGETLSETMRENIATTIDKLKKGGVQHFHYSDRYWFDINSFEPNGVDSKRLAENYANCFLAACRRMYNGTLYHCPYQCNGVKMEKFGRVPGDFIHIHSHTDRELAAELDKFEEVNFIDACRYCSIPTGAREVTAGEQIKHSA